ncbi:MAG: hypothetical protein LBJ00_01530 [Planctomycetaceae bacterium]|nr:hypothetical protein [Planctomycetaceae bacterium]
MLRLPNALRCRFTAASGILKQLQYIFLFRHEYIKDALQKHRSYTEAYRPYRRWFTFPPVVRLFFCGMLLLSLSVIQRWRNWENFGRIAQLVRAQP